MPSDSKQGHLQALSRLQGKKRWAALNAGYSGALGEVYRVYPNYPKQWKKTNEQRKNKAGEVYPNYPTPIKRADKYFLKIE